MPKLDGYQMEHWRAELMLEHYVATAGLSYLSEGWGIHLMSR
jgi:hypothetical protein